MDVDLTALGIFNITDLDSNEYVEYHTENCLYRALEYEGLDDTSLKKLREKNYRRDTTMKEVKEIAHDLDITICIRDLKGMKSHRFGSKGKVFRLGIAEKHFFPDIEIDITSYAIENYEIVQGMERWNKIFACSGGYYQRADNRQINSCMVINNMIKHNRFKPVTVDKLMKTVYSDKAKVNITELGYFDKCIKYITHKEVKPRKVVRVFFDFETVTIDSILKPRECVWKYEEKIFYSHGFLCGKDFIDDILKIKNYDEIHLIAHNAKFDFSYICQHLPGQINLCMAGARFITAKVHLKNKVQIIVKDSFNFIGHALRKFGEIFKLDIGKGDFDHNKLVPEMFDEKGLFLKEYSDIRNESLDYCVRDVEVLEKGYNIFGNWVNDLGLNIDNILTSASLAIKYATKEGCFDGVAKLTGTPKAFIMQAVYGGRVMTSENKMHHVGGDEFEYDEDKMHHIIPQGDDIKAFDANSLYPSACVSIAGFVKGAPKIIRDEDHFLDVCIFADYYYVDIKITKVGNHLKMPLIAKRSKDSIEYTNDAVGMVMTVGKTYLEDLIKYQDIEFDFIRGYYFDEGVNNKIVDVIRYLYNTRNNFKKAGNPAEQVYKLIMNSIYGKTLEKDKNKSIRVFNNEDDMMRNVYLNKKHVEQAQQVYGCDKWIVRNYEKTDKQFNYCHVGVQILDQSKHIMNDAICNIENKGKTVFYTDTDSIYMLGSSIDCVPKELIGSGLGQFKFDYENGKEAFFIGKKSYVIVDDKDDTHIRLKGVPTNVIMHKAKIEEKDPIDLYGELYDYKKVKFDLTNGGERLVLKFKFDQSIEKINEFDRII